ncbi:MAG TPA: hypothetical protein VNT58_04910 [Gaiellaceae bacterium]|nr:hypothetical protein [Gaiellaceae bacterium]
MAARDDFTVEEWEALERGAVGSGLLVAVSDRSFLDTFKEAGALARHMAETRSATQSALVRELAQTRGAPFGLTASPGEVESGTTEALRTAAAALREKAPEELESYRSFVTELATRVAAAAPGGEGAEAEAIAKIEAALR